MTDFTTAFGESISSQYICLLYLLFCGSSISLYSLSFLPTCEVHWDLKEVLWDLFSETDNELSMQHAYPVHQEISDEILPMHYGRTFTRERKKRVKPAQLSSIRDLTQLNV